MNWFECKISYEKIMENGSVKKVTEPYLVDALSHAEAEARIIEEIRPYISGEFTVATVRRARISELFFNESGDRFYKAKVAFLTLDEKSGAEKRIKTNILVQASGITEGIDLLEEGMKGTMSDYVLTGIEETAIADVFLYQNRKS